MRDVVIDIALAIPDWLCCCWPLFLVTVYFTLGWFLSRYFADPMLFIRGAILFAFGVLIGCLAR